MKNNPLTGRCSHSSMVCYHSVCYVSPPESWLDTTVLHEYLTVLALIFGGIAIGTINERKKNV